MTTFPAFLLARLAEDEAAARAVADRPGMDRAVADLPAPVFDYVVANGPRRVLADVAAKRAIVALHEARWITPEDWWACGTCGVPGEYDVIAPCPTLRHLASVYRDHPEFDEGWAL